MWWIERVNNLDWGCFEFRPPATPSEITKAEASIGLSFPEDLRQFYLEANGFYGDNNGWEYSVIASLADTVILTENLRLSAYKFEEFRDVGGLLQIGYESNTHCHTLYFLPTSQVLKNYPDMLPGVYEFSPKEPDHPYWEGYIRYWENLEKYICGNFDFSTE